MRNTATTEQEAIQMMNTEDVICELNDIEAYFNVRIAKRMKIGSFGKANLERRNLLIAELERRELVLEPA